MRYGASEITNSPVNLSLCKEIVKQQLKWYPDNMGLPTIKFEGCDTSWVYSCAESRDLDYKMIANNEYIKK